MPAKRITFAPKPENTPYIPSQLNGQDTNEQSDAINDHADRIDVLEAAAFGTATGFTPLTDLTWNVATDGTNKHSLTPTEPTEITVDNYLPDWYGLLDVTQGATGYPIIINDVVVEEASVANTRTLVGIYVDADNNIKTVAKDVSNLRKPVFTLDLQDQIFVDPGGSPAGLFKFKGEATGADQYDWLFVDNTGNQTRLTNYPSALAYPFSAGPLSLQLIAINAAGETLSSPAIGALSPAEAPTFTSEPTSPMTINGGGTVSASWSATGVPAAIITTEGTYADPVLSGSTYFNIPNVNGVINFAPDTPGTKVSIRAKLTNTTFPTPVYSSLLTVNINKVAGAAPTVFVVDSSGTFGTFTKSVDGPDFEDYEYFDTINESAYIDVPSNGQVPIDPFTAYPAANDILVRLKANNVKLASSTIGNTAAIPQSAYAATPLTFGTSTGLQLVTSGGHQDWTSNSSASGWKYYGFATNTLPASQIGGVYFQIVLPAGITQSPGIGFKTGTSVPNGPSGAAYQDFDFGLYMSPPGDSLLLPSALALSSTPSDVNCYLGIYRIPAPGGFDLYTKASLVEADMQSLAPGNGQSLMQNVNSLFNIFLAMPPGCVARDPKGVNL